MLKIYKAMLELIRRRKDIIQQASLEDELLNREWNLLVEQEDTLIKLIKVKTQILKEKGDGIVQE